MMGETQTEKWSLQVSELVCQLDSCSKANSFINETTITGGRDIAAVDKEKYIRIFRVRYTVGQLPP